MIEYCKNAAFVVAVLLAIFGYGFIATHPCHSDPSIDAMTVGCAR